MVSWFAQTPATVAETRSDLDDYGWSHINTTKGKADIGLDWGQAKVNRWNNWKGEEGFGRLARGEAINRDAGHGSGIARIPDCRGRKNGQIHAHYSLTAEEVEVGEGSVK